MIGAITKEHEDVHPIFAPEDGVPFTASTINLGPQTVTVPHTDHANPAYGICAVTALGRFTADTGGHLVLPEFRLIIRFPPGATIILPSAAVIHYNLPIPPTEERFSIVQYTAAGLFRWWAHGFRTTAQYRQALNITNREWREQAAARLRAGINRFTLLSSLGHRSEPMNAGVPNTAEALSVARPAGAPSLRGTQNHEYPRRSPREHRSDMSKKGKGVDKSERPKKPR